MATVTLRSLVHSVPSVTTRLKSQKHPSPLISFSLIFLPKCKTLSATQISPVISRRNSAFAITSYTESDTEYVEGEKQKEEEKEGKEEFTEVRDEETGEEVLEARPVKAAPKRLKKDRARLYVGNLPFSATSDELSDLFCEAGTVVSAEVIYDRVTDRSRGFAFVTMSSVEESNEAIRMFDGSQLGGRSIKVNFPEVPRGGEREVLSTSTRPSRGYIDSPHKIYAGNLGWSVTSDGLKVAFSDQPGLLGARVIYDRETGRSRGFGFVSFASAEEAQAALDTMNGVEVDGRPLRLSPANSSPSIRSSSQEEGTEVQNSSLETSSMSV